MKRPECFEFAMSFLGDPEAAEMRAYVEALEIGVGELRADIAEALMHDCENGVKWLNEAAAEKFKKDYPELHKVLNGEKS